MESIESRVAALEERVGRLQQIASEAGAAASAILAIVGHAAPEMRPALGREVHRAADDADRNGNEAIAAILRGSLLHLDV